MYRLCSGSEMAVSKYTVALSGVSFRCPFSIDGLRQESYSSAPWVRAILHELRSLTSLTHFSAADTSCLESAPASSRTDPLRVIRSITSVKLSRDFFRALSIWYASSEMSRFFDPICCLCMCMCLPQFRILLTTPRPAYGTST